MTLWLRIPLLVLLSPVVVLLGIGWVVIVAMVMCAELFSSAIGNRRPDLAGLWSEGLDMWDFWL